MESAKSNPITISLCMIVKNEEKVLARCLDSVKEAMDEIIIVDTGSTDQTKAIARRYTDKVYDFEWINDFAAARNFSFSKATMDYQMWMDADDVMPGDSLLRLIRLKQDLDPQIDIIMAKYITHFDGNGNAVHFSTRERILRRERGYVWEGAVHECIPVIGVPFQSDIELHHKKIEIKEGQEARNLKIYEEMERNGKPFNPREQYYYARELKDHGIWIKSAYYFEKFLDGGNGWVEDNIATCHSLSMVYNMLGDQQKILPVLLRSFEYAPPRAEICCEIGYYYQRAKNFDASLRWFSIAASMEMPNTVGFILVDCWGYIPNIECCVCCFEMGDYKKAKKYNEAAALFKPDSPAIEINRNALRGR